LKVAKATEKKLFEWTNHSAVFVMQKLILATQDIIALAQELSMKGGRGLKPVGVIEADLLVPMFWTNLIRQPDTRQARRQYNEVLLSTAIIDLELLQMERLRDDMVEEVSRLLGHTSWHKVVSIRHKKLEPIRKEVPSQQGDVKSEDQPVRVFTNLEVTRQI
jgi:hypothetical protein